MSELLRQSAEFSLYGSNLRADIDIAADLWKAEVDRRPNRTSGQRADDQRARSDAHGGTVRISARNIELEDKPGALLPGGRYVKVAIADHGGGFRRYRDENLRSLFHNQAGRQRTRLGDQLFRSSRSTAVCCIWSNLACRSDLLPFIFRQPGQNWR